MRDITRTGCSKPRAPMAWPGPFAATAPRTSSASSSSLAPSRNGVRRSVSDVREQTRPQLAVGGEPQPVAAVTERLGHARDDTHPAGCAVDEAVGRRWGRPTLERLEGKAIVHRGEDLLGGDDARGDPSTAGAQRHVLDEAHVAAGATRERGELDDLVVVGASDDHDVDLDRCETRLGRGVDAGEHPVERVASGDLGEAVRDQRVEADVHPVQAGRGELARRGGRAWCRWW